MVSPSLILMERFGMLVSGVIQSHSCGEVWYVSKWCHPVSFLWRGLGCEFTVVCMNLFFFSSDLNTNIYKIPGSRFLSYGFTVD